MEAMNKDQLMVAFCYRRRNKGFTLIEVLIALAISGLLMTAVYTAFQSQQRSYLAQDQVAEVQQNIRAGISMLVQELRMAGYDPYSSGSAGITDADGTSITFTMVADDDGVDNDNADGDDDSSTGADEVGELKTLTFELYDAYGDGVDDIGRQVGNNASTKRAIAENFDGLEFRYLDEDGNVVDTSVSASLRNIRSVQVSVLARTDRPDSQYTNTESYVTPGGTVWGPFNDNLRRRFQTITVKLRNMEI
jgi:type IV pilus assembly protein PilW